MCMGCAIPEIIRCFTSAKAPATGHHSVGAMSAEEFERIHGAEELRETDIRHKILVIKINKLYQRGMDEDVLYDAVRGVWRASRNRVRTVDYVFGVYNSLIVAVYKPTQWYVCKEAAERRPRQDEAQQFYLHKSIAGIKLNQSAQNPITYLNSV